MESLIKSQPAECIKLRNIKHSIQFAVAILELLLLYNSAVFLPGVYTCLQYVFGNMVTLGQNNNYKLRSVRVEVFY